MNKQELLDKAIEDWQGIYKPECSFVYGYTSASNYSACGLNLIPGCGYIFSKADFENRAKELGWVSGYLWGKEYPTNGKKPDLDDDVMVQVKFHNENLWRGGSVSLFIWSNTVSFRVTDDRYKPKQQEETTLFSIGGQGGAGYTTHFDIGGGIGASKPDNSWHEKGKLPQVGSEIEVFADGEEVRQIHVVWSGDGVVFGWDMGSPFVYAHFSAKAYGFRPIKSEREKFVEAASKIMHQSQCGAINDISLGELYEAGCRFVSQESSR